MCTCVCVCFCVCVCVCVCVIHMCVQPVYLLPARHLPLIFSCLQKRHISDYRINNRSVSVLNGRG